MAYLNVKTMVQMLVLKSTFYLSFVIRRNLNHGSEDKPGLVSTGLNQGLFSFCNKADNVCLLSKSMHV